MNDHSLDAASSVLAKAFGSDCENKKGFNKNTTNYRLHELMLQLVVLNGNVSENNKWQKFNELARRPQKFGKRTAWMADENSFNERVKYISDHGEEYKTRLTNRAAQYNIP